MFKDLVEVELPDLIDCVLGDIEEIKAIFLVDQSVRKYSQNLVQPQPNSLVLSLQFLFIRHADSIDHLSEVSQVEQVVRLGRCGQELFDGILIDLEGRTEDLGLSLQDVAVEAKGAEEPFQDGREDTIEGFIFERGQRGE